MYISYDYAETNGLALNSWRRFGMTISYLTAMLFSATNTIMWIISYTNGATLYYFYFWSVINRWFAISGFWIGPICLIIHLGVNDTLASDDYSIANLIFLIALGAFTVILDFMFKERLDWWLIRWLYEKEGDKDAAKKVLSDDWLSKVWEHMWANFERKPIDIAGRFNYAHGKGKVEVKVAPAKEEPEENDETDENDSEFALAESALLEDSSNAENF